MLQLQKPGANAKVANACLPLAGNFCRDAVHKKAKAEALEAVVGTTEGKYNCKFNLISISLNSAEK